MNVKNCPNCWVGDDGVDHYCDRHARLFADAMKRSRFWNDPGTVAAITEALDAAPADAEIVEAMNAAREAGHDPLMISVREDSQEGRSLAKAVKACEEGRATAIRISSRKIGQTYRMKFELIK